MKKTGLLIVNLGSPDAPTPSAVRRYLAQFLSDPRVVDTNRLIWWLVLHGIILRIRPARAARAYQKVWTDQGSPLIAISKKQRDAISEQLASRFGDDIITELAMTYGNPSIEKGINALDDAGVKHILVLPLYPQYSHTTSGAVFDAVHRVIKNNHPELQLINNYHDHPAYITAIASSIKQHWQTHERGELLLFSFHGIPQRYVDNGDPYYDQCATTAQLIARELKLNDDQWKLVFQSRFGREPWLQPYCDKTLVQLPQTGIKTVDILCPGFSADCLETLEEIQMENRDIFIEAGGTSFHYIACLNNNQGHIDALCDIVSQHLPD